MLLLTLRGTPTLYYGDELGLEDVTIPEAMVQDPWEKNVPGLKLGRDPVRTPMPWDASECAGFTAGKPWLPLNADQATRNVVAMADDPTSILSLYRDLLALRRTSLALRRGSIRVQSERDEVLAYVREHGGERILVCLNFAAAPRALTLPTEGIILLSTSGTRQNERAARSVSLAAHEGLIVRLSPSG
jgi:alpha-glucosidase